MHATAPSTRPTTHATVRSLQLSSVTRRCVRALAMAIGLLLAGACHAQIGREQAAAIAQRESGGGRVLSVERAQADRQAMWRVKVVTPRGEVRVLLIDAGDNGANSGMGGNDGRGGGDPNGRPGGFNRGHRGG